MEESKVVLEVKNLSVLIKDRFLVKNINLTINEGECVGVIGEKKSGKTSLIKAVSGTLPISQGQVFLLGKDIFFDKKILTKVSTCFDPPVFFKYQSVYENMKYVAMLNPNFKKETILETLKKFGLEKKAKTKVLFLSYFERKLMSLAIGFMTKPKLLLLDEPFKSLPKQNLYQIKQLINEVRKNGTAVIITSQSLEEIESECNRFIFMESRVIKNTMTKEEADSITGGTSFAYVKVKYPHYVGKLIMENFFLKVKLLGQRVLFEADERTTAQIVRFITKRNMAVYSAGYINKKADKIFASLTPYFKQEDKA